MSTSVQARQARPLNLSSLAHITAVDLIAFDSEGLLFDGDLTDEEIIAAWWYATSADDADEAFRKSIAVDIADAEAGTNGTSWLTLRYAELARYAIRYGVDNP